MLNGKRKKNQGPACACGKGDLYEEWLKSENNKKEASEAATSNQTEDSNNSDDSAGEEDLIKEQSK